jgi:hypothetical protein
MTPPAKTRDEGQWALGGTEPLNANEEFKNQDAPLNVRERIESRYAIEGFDSIDKTDLRGRFDAVSLNTNELEDTQRLAILVLSDEFGAVVREIDPPKR